MSGGVNCSLTCKSGIIPSRLSSDTVDPAAMAVNKELRVQMLIRRNVTLYCIAGQLKLPGSAVSIPLSQALVYW